MIVVEDYSNNKRFSFVQMIFDTDEKLITIQYNDEPRIVSFVEIYSAIKQLFIKNQNLLMHPFPMELITESSIKMINNYGLRIL